MEKKGNFLLCYPGRCKQNSGPMNTIPKKRGLKREIKKKEKKERIFTE
jgi:hypothetical protein